MNTKIQSLIQIIELVEYDQDFCILVQYSHIFVDVPHKACSLEHDCEDCIFNGVNQPDHNTLDVLIKDLKNE